ncbi:MAG: hypothetical protein AB7O24_20055 [Kofleriaceae bacterium]
MRIARPALAVAVAAGALASCGETTTIPTQQRNLDRPTDVAFACYGGLKVNGLPDGQNIQLSAQPVEACNIRSGPHDSSTPAPVPPGQEGVTNAVSWYGFVLQSAPGTVVVTEFPTKPSTAFGGADIIIRDEDSSTPGKNGIAIGEDPVGIVTDRSGCYMLTANAGTCDVSALDVGSALDAVHTEVRLERYGVKNAMGTPILAKPAAITMDKGTSPIGDACPMAPTGIMYVAYPSCHLVAAVDVSTQTIVAGISYDSGTPVITDGNVTCAAECGAGGTVTAGIRPVAVDLEQDERTMVRRMLIGAENSPTLTVVELDANWLPTSLLPIALQDTTGTLGVTAVAMSPQIGMGGDIGVINDDSAVGGQFQFAYGIATDDTIRVAEILTLSRECDTQVDPRLIHDNTNVNELSCFPVGEPTTPARRPGAIGPGIQLSADAIPTSIEIFKAKELEPDVREPGPGKLIGYYGIITASNSATYVLNVDDDSYPDLEDPADPLKVDMPFAIANQLRDSVRDRNLTNAATGEVLCDDFGPEPEERRGGPRITDFPARVVPTGTVAPEKAFELPMLRQVECVGADQTRPVPELGFGAPVATRELVFPDIRGVRDEVITFTWQGSLSVDGPDADIDGPAVRLAQLFVDAAGMRMVDQARPFCEAGVEPYDVVQLRGCNPTLGDIDCPLGYTCYVHPDSQVVGLGACMLENEADRLANACKDFLTSQRRYTVGKSESGTLTLLPRKHVLNTTPIDGCMSDMQCQDLANYAARLASSANPESDATPADPRVWACRTDADRAPLTAPGQTNMRCVETCSETQACSAGYVCREGTCMEGVTPPQACVNAPQRFEVRAGEAFTVVGSRSGYVHPMIADPSGACIRNPAASPYTVGRIPLSPPPCDPTADLRSGKLPGGGYEPNPCSVTIDQTEVQPSYVADTCTFADPITKLVTRQAPAIRFRNHGILMHMVDPFYPGDAKCIGDRAGTLSKVPTVVPGYQFVMDVTSGLQSLLLSIGPTFPVKVVRGPTQSIWVIDAGDFLSTSVTTPSTRGRVYRIEAQGLAQINILE